MSALTVIAFSDQADAVAYERSLARSLAVVDAEVIEGTIMLWDTDDSAPRSRHLANVALRGSASLGLWSMVLGLAVNLRLLDQELPLSALESVGVPAHLLSFLRDRVLPGTAVICLLTQETIGEALPDNHHAVLVQVSLTAGQDAQLHRVFQH